jgi:predicted membrane metal-binding protein
MNPTLKHYAIVAGVALITAGFGLWVVGVVLGTGNYNSCTSNPAPSWQLLIACAVLMVLGYLLFDHGECPDE